MRINHIKEKELRAHHNNPKNWYSKICVKCKKRYYINTVTKPELDEELNFCFDCYKKRILDE